MDKIIIRKMTQKDIEEVAQTEQQIFSVPWSKKGFEDSLTLDSNLFLVVRENEEAGKLIGYCGLMQSFEEADITNVAVREEYRGQGIAQKMLKELMRLGRERGIERYTLEVRVSNADALHVYEKLGFETVGIRRNFYEKPREDAAIMWTK